MCRKISRKLQKLSPLPKKAEAPPSISTLFDLILSLQRAHIPITGVFNGSSIGRHCRPILLMAFDQDAIYTLFAFLAKD